MAQQPSGRPDSTILSRRPIRFVGRPAPVRHDDGVIDREPTDAGMRLGEVLAVLVDLRQAGCHFWIAGGWGVDALVGRQTRPRRDLDLAVNAEHEAAAVGALGLLGYRIETDWRPVRVVVPCLSREQQVQFHRGYVPRAVDLHDLRLLDELASTP